ncbi:MAG TPA: hypothetical protein VGB85_14910 [Nannocystis sp.]
MDATTGDPRNPLRRLFDAVIFVVQLPFNPAVVLALMMLLGFQFPGNPLLLEYIGPNEYRPSTAGACILIVLCVVLSLVLLRWRLGRWWATDAVTPWMLPANAVAAGALSIWISSGLEGNLIAFAFMPPLGLTTLYWFYWLGRAPKASAKP